MVNKMVEELGELTQAAMKYQNNPSTINLERMTEELADVYITTNHVVHRFGLYNRRKIYIVEKFKRLYNKLNGDEKQ